MPFIRGTHFVVRGTHFVVLLLIAQIAQQFLRHIALSKSTTGRIEPYNTIGQSAQQLDFPCQ
jgi:hypothetical protein